MTSRGLVQGLAAVLLAAVPAFAEPAPNRKIDRGLQESLREGGAIQHVIISVKPEYRAEIHIVWGTSEDGDNIVWGNLESGDNIVWGASVLKGGLF